MGRLSPLLKAQSRLTLPKKADRKTAQAVAGAVIELLELWKRLIHTIYSNNSKEFADHEGIAMSLEATICFAHPSAAWGRGTNENSYGLVRQCFPKGLDFSTITDEKTIMAECKLNYRPRIYLDIDAPNEIFFQSSCVVALRG